MKKLLEIFKNTTLNDAIKIEENDLQFISLKKLYENITNKNVYLFLIVANSLVCYQLSGKGEDYWEEFLIYFSKIKNISQQDVIDKLIKFIKNSKNNKRLVNIKIKRLEKLRGFIDSFEKKKSFYYENMEIFRDDLALFMNQKKDAKTIVFAVKMFSYGARNYFKKFIAFPDIIEIPIDSRLENIFRIYNTDKNLKIKDFYKILSKKLIIPPLHLDAVLWCNYEKLSSNNHFCHS